MPKIPRNRYNDNDDWDDPNEFEIEDDEPKDRHGRRLPREDREFEERRRDQWRKRNRDE